MGQFTTSGAATYRETSQRERISSLKADRIKIELLGTGTIRGGSEAVHDQVMETDDPLAILLGRGCRILIRGHGLGRVWLNSAASVAKALLKAV